MKKKILITAGGTGGHIFPAQSVSNILIKNKDCDVTLLTDGRGQALKGFSSAIKVIKLPIARNRNGIINKLFFFSALLLSCIIAFCFVLFYRPKVVIGFGGFPSIPGLLSAIFIKKIIRCKVYVHEQNTYLGKVNRKVQKWLDKIIISFPDVQQLKEKSKATYIGPLVRDGFTEIGKQAYTCSDKKGPIHILITGGSQGAKIFSDIIPDACRLLPDDIKKRLYITQQCRAEELDTTHDAYRKLGIKHDVKSFINNMPDAIKQAHLLICRSGASTVSEMIQARRPGILIPFPFATDDHQRHNAQILVDRQASWMILNKDLSAANLSKLMKNLLSSDKLLKKAADNLKTLSVNNAAEEFAKLIKDI